MTDDRAIMHLDMDAFFASVEQLDDPALRGRPVLVGYDGPRGVVAAASYEARRFGCHSAQPVAVAKRLCPEAVVVRGHFGRYRELSRAVFAILEDVSPVVEPLSIDEAFVDVTGSGPLLGTPETIARDVKRRVRDETGLTASVGIAPNKFLAKLASDWDKPDGLTVILASELPDRLAPLPIARMWGVGPAAETRLVGLGIRTFGDLQRLSRAEAHGLLGAHADHYWKLARGEDRRVVTSDGRARSISSEQTFGHDLEAADAVRRFLLGQCEQVAHRLRRAGLRGRTITVKIRYGAFQTVTRAATLDAATDRTDTVWDAAGALFTRWCEGGFHPVRLIGVAVSHLESDRGRQLELFTNTADDRRRRLDEATDAITERFGGGAIRRGG